MARRKPQNVPYNSDLFNAAMRSLGQSSESQVASWITRESGLLKNMTDQIERSGKKIKKSIEVNMRQPLDDFFSSGDKASKATGQQLARNFTNPMYAAFDQIEARSVKTHKRIADQMTAAFKNFKQPAAKGKVDWLSHIKSSYALQNIAPTVKGMLHETDLLDKIPGGKVLSPLLQLGPRLFMAGSAIAAVIGGVSKLLTSLIQLQSETQGLFKTFAGNDTINKFTADIGSLALKTNMSTAEVVDLAGAMHNAGQSITGSREQFDQLLIANSKAVRMFGASADTAAQFSRTLVMSGQTAAGVSNVYDDLYQTMQRGQGTIADIAGALRDGVTLWREYGGATGLAAAQFASSTLQIGLASRKMNVDAGLMQNQFASSLDAFTRRRQATFMSNVLGGSQSKNFQDLNTSGGQMRMAEAAMSFLQRQQGSAFQMSDEQLKKRYTSEQYESIMLQRQRGLNMLGGRGFDSKLAGQLQASFSAYSQNHHGASIGQFIRDAQSGKTGSKSLQEGLSNLNCPD